MQQNHEATYGLIYMFTKCAIGIPKFVALAVATGGHSLWVTVPGAMSSFERGNSIDFRGRVSCGSDYAAERFAEADWKSTAKKAFINGLKAGFFNEAAQMHIMGASLYDFFKPLEFLKFERVTNSQGNTVNGDSTNKAAAIRFWADQGVITPTKENLHMAGHRISGYSYP